MNVSGLANLTGNVGIGGSLTLSDPLRISDYTSCTALETDSSGNLVCGSDSGSGVTSGTGALGAVTFWDSSSTLSNSVANFYWDSTNYRLGIGTSSPQYRLDVNGTGYVSGFLGVGSSLNVAGNVGIGQSLTVTSATALSTLNTTGLANLASLNVVGLSQLTGNVGIGSSLTVTGLGVFNGGINVSGLSNLTGNVGIGGSLTVNSPVQISAYNCSTLSNNGKLTTDANGNLVCLPDTFNDEPIPTNPLKYPVPVTSRVY